MTTRPRRTASARVADAPKDQHQQDPCNDTALVDPGCPWAAVYARVSDDQDGTSESVAEQIPLMTGVLNRMGFWVEAVFYDVDKSGSKEDVQRPGFEAAFAWLCATPNPVIGSRHSDRLSRNQIDNARINVYGRKHKARTIDHKGKVRDLAVADLGWGVEQLLNMHQSEKISENVALTYRARHAQGRVYKVPFGWRRAADGTLTLDPAEAEVIRRMARCVLTFGSMNALLRDLAREGVTSKQGKPLTHASARVILLADHTIGNVVVKGELLTTLPGPAPLTRDEQERIRAIYGNQTRGRQTSDVGHLLSGVLACECGARMSGHTHTRRNAAGQIVAHPVRYRCKACGNSIKSDGVDRRVRTAVLEWQADPARAERLLAQRDVYSAEREALEARLVKLRAVRRRVLDRYETSDDYTDDEVDAKLATLDADTAAVRADLATVDERAAVASVSLDALGADFDALPIPQRRSQIRAALRTITVGKRAAGMTGHGVPRGYVDLDRVTIQPR